MGSPDAQSAGRSQSSAQSTFVTGIDVDVEGDAEDDDLNEDDDNLGPLVVPSSLLRKSLNMSNGKVSGGDPGKLSAAIHALRYALKASDDEGLALTINDPRKGINRPNASYRARALPKRPFVSKIDKEMARREEEKEGLRAITPGVINAKLKAKEDGKSALFELQDMLESMNDRMEDIEKMKDEEFGVSERDGRARTAGITSRSGDRAIKNLVTMVNETIKD